MLSNNSKQDLGLWLRKPLDFEEDVVVMYDIGFKYKWFEARVVSKWGWARRSGMSIGDHYRLNEDKRWRMLWNVLSGSEIIRGNMTNVRLTCVFSLC